MNTNLVLHDDQSQLKIVIQAPPLINTDHRVITITPYYNKHSISGMLANLHAGYFRISFSLCAQVLLWKTLIQFTNENHVHQLLFPMLRILPSIACTILWSISLFILVILTLVYALRCVHHLEQVKAEFMDDVGVNYLFAPWISCLLLLETSPFDVPKDGVYLQVICFALVLPIIILDIKIYGQWFTKGKRFLSKMANPTCQISVIANLVAAKVAMYMGWLEGGLALFSLGMAHYLVLFVTLYQQLPGSNGVSLPLRPVFFLFIATPSMASLAWSSINNGDFDNGSKMLFFLSVFLFMSLVCRPSLFKKSIKKFSIAWWAYSFPLTLLALASIEYAQAINHEFARTFALILSILSILVSFVLMIFTTINFNKLFIGTYIRIDGM